MRVYADHELPLTSAGALLICGHCHALRGPVPGRADGAEQFCLCASRAMWRAQPKRGDHNVDMELCYCCGLVLLRSGSKWSTWLCGACKEWVLALNESAGRCLIPIGRHSMMNGVALNGYAGARGIERFVSDSHALAASMDQIASYAHDVVVPLNLDAIGFARRRHVPLGTYLEAVESSQLNQWDAFERLQQWLARR